MSKTFIESARPIDVIATEDPVFEVPLRPQALSEFSGQDAIRERLEVMIGAAKLRKETLGHCLFSGPPGLGKTTLANILARSMGTNIVITSGPVLEKPGDLAGMLTRMQTGDILFIDELHRLNCVVEEYLYSAMEDFVLDIMIDNGPAARSVQVKLNKFTLIGATTRVGLLSAPLRSRFGFTCRLDYYNATLLSTILQRMARILNLNLEEAAAMEIACRARGTPRIAINLLRWVRDYAQMRTQGLIDQNVANMALNMLSIDHLGLEEMDIRILSVLMDHYNGGPAGLNAIAAAIGEEAGTIEEVYEPYLIMLGLLKRTRSGREATPQAYQHLGRTI